MWVHDGDEATGRVAVGVPAQPERLRDVVGLVVEVGERFTGAPLGGVDAVRSQQRRRSGLSEWPRAGEPPLAHRADARHPAAQLHAQVGVVAGREHAAAAVHVPRECLELRVDHRVRRPAGAGDAEQPDLVVPRQVDGIELEVLDVGGPVDVRVAVRLRHVKGRES